jgi:hypothetical protein
MMPAIQLLSLMSSIRWSGPGFHLTQDLYSMTSAGSYSRSSFSHILFQPNAFMKFAAPAPWAHQDG